LTGSLWWCVHSAPCVHTSTGPPTETPHELLPLPLPTRVVILDAGSCRFLSPVSFHPHLFPPSPRNSLYPHPPPLPPRNSHCQTTKYVTSSFVPKPTFPGIMPDSRPTPQYFQVPHLLILTVHGSDKIIDVRCFLRLRFRAPVFLFTIFFFRFYLSWTLVWRGGPPPHHPPPAGVACLLGGALSTCPRDVAFFRLFLAPRPRLMLVRRLQLSGHRHGHLPMGGAISARPPTPPATWRARPLQLPAPQRRRWPPPPPPAARTSGQLAAVRSSLRAKSLATFPC